MLKREFCFKEMLTLVDTGVKNVTLRFNKIKFCFLNFIRIRNCVTYLQSKIYKHLSQ